MSSFVSRLLLPHSFSPARPLHVPEAEEDLSMLARGLDELTAQSFGALFTATGQIIFCSTSGVPHVLDPGDPGQLTGVTRGVNGSSQSPHLVGDTVCQAVWFMSINDAQMYCGTVKPS